MHLHGTWRNKANEKIQEGMTKVEEELPAHLVNFGYAWFTCGWYFHGFGWRDGYEDSSNTLPSISEYA